MSAIVYEFQRKDAPKTLRIRPLQFEELDYRLLRLTVRWLVVSDRDALSFLELSGLAGNRTIIVEFDRETSEPTIIYDGRPTVWDARDCEVITQLIENWRYDPKPRALSITDNDGRSVKTVCIPFTSGRQLFAAYVF